MEFVIRVLDHGELAGFRPYLLPQTAARLERREENLLALGAVTGRSACGAVAALTSGTTAELTDLFVDEAARRQGAGRFLLRSMLNLLTSFGVRTVTADYVLGGEDVNAMDGLLAACGFSQFQSRSRVFQTNSRNFHDSARFSRAFSPQYRTPEGVRSFCLLSQGMKEELLESEDIPSALTWESVGNRALSDLSVALVREGRLEAYLLAGESADSGYVLLSAFRRTDAPPGAFLTLLTELVNRCYYRAGGDFPFYFSALNSHVEQLALHLMGDRFTDYEEHVCTRTLAPGTLTDEQEV